VQQVLVCDPRRNALLKEGSKSDMVDARKLAEVLRTGMLRPVYHGENGLRTLRELGRSYQTTSKDLTRVMNRLKALYRGWGIPCAGTQVYAPRYREEWLSKIAQAGCAAGRSCSISLHFTDGIFRPGVFAKDGHYRILLCARCSSAHLAFSFLSAYVALASITGRHHCLN
jgi:hypothetical protein